MMINVKLTQGQTHCEVLSAKTILSSAQPIVGCGWRYSSGKFGGFRKKGYLCRRLLNTPL